MRQNARVMSNKTIAKFCCFVISASAACSLFAACGFVFPNPTLSNPESQYGPPVINGFIKSPDITESSGIAASRCQSNVLWTHNDSGDDAFIFALNGTGVHLGAWRVPNTLNLDWEDIAAYKDAGGSCFIYIGEIGDNKGKRPEHAVYRIPEPLIMPDAARSSRKEPLFTGNPEVIRFRYPDYDQDAETLMVHPKTGDIYVATKRISGPSGVYRLKLEFNGSEPQKAQLVAELSVPAVPNGLLTGGDISPDGRRVIVCDYNRAYEMVLSENAANFDEIWKQTPTPVDLGKRKGGEAVGYSVDGTSIFGTSEKRDSPVIEVKRR